MLKRIDHLICEVPDIELAHRRLLGAGWQEAWPIGPFWPSARTSGIAIGGLNLELVQPFENAPRMPVIRKIVFEPSSIEEAVAAFESLPLRCEVFEKWEGNPELLELRGYKGEELGTAQMICTNVYPAEGEVPFPFFLCQYSPFQVARLGPERFLIEPFLKSIEFAVPDPLRAQSFLAECGYSGTISVRFAVGKEPKVTRLIFSQQVTFGITGDFEVSA